MGNPEGFLLFLKKIRLLGRSRNLFVDLSSVRTIHPDGIAAFLATISHRDVSNAQISGNVPHDLKLQHLLEESGFYEYVGRKSGPTKQPPMGAIRKRQHSGEVFNEKFNQFIALELIEFATLKLRGVAGRHPPTYCILGEAMLNTVHHASLEPNEPEPWWASVYCDAERNRACFTFVDQGVGIFQSNRLGFRLKLAKDLFFKDRGEILRELMHGNIPSSTKHPGRGNGIPGMYKHCKAKRIRSFTVLSNDAIGNADDEIFKPLRTSYDGTLLYWEVEP